MADGPPWRMRAGLVLYQYDGTRCLVLERLVDGFLSGQIYVTRARATPMNVNADPGLCPPRCCSVSIDNEARLGPDGYQEEERHRSDPDLSTREWLSSTYTNRNDLHGLHPDCLPSVADQPDRIQQAEDGERHTDHHSHRCAHIWSVTRHPECEGTRVEETSDQHLDRYQWNSYDQAVEDRPESPLSPSRKDKLFASLRSQPVMADLRHRLVGALAPLRTIPPPLCRVAVRVRIPSSGCPI